MEETTVHFLFFSILHTSQSQALDSKYSNSFQFYQIHFLFADRSVNFEENFHVAFT